MSRLPVPPTAENEADLAPHLHAILVDLCDEIAHLPSEQEKPEERIH